MSTYIFLVYLKDKPNEVLLALHIWFKRVCFSSHIPDFIWNTFEGEKRRNTRQCIIKWIACLCFVVIGLSFFFPLLDQLWYSKSNNVGKRKTSKAAVLLPLI